MKAIYLLTHKTDQKLAHVATADNSKRSTAESEIKYLVGVAKNKINHPTDNKLSKFYQTLVTSKNGLDVWNIVKVGTAKDKIERNKIEQDLRTTLEQAGMYFFTTKKNKKG
jgi:hypothetical protein